ncbi:MAG: filamentous hemagglutinin N-terminal domain-containing protein [Rivularia sp. ALOHA_DT_140]|nr:filamentous hemagglutinin N-terminal domain-containing protein [Rivularia sp. ALOHA_DT_140]
MRSTTYSDWSIRCKQIILFIGISLLTKESLPVLAQTRISGDATLPTLSKVNNLQNGIYEITGGSRPQNATNLFHSLKEFSIQSGNTARFVHDAEIKNILTRVTGGSVSNINGTIQTWIDGVKPSTANLFVINPKGIIFGENAILNIGGSFFGSTAEAIKFADGTEFSAVNPSTQPLLTISLPIGLQLGSNSNSSINIDGTGNNIKVNPDFSIDTSKRPSGLNYNNSKQNSNNQTLALIGNEIILNGGNITFSSGQVDSHLAPNRINS